MIIFTFTVLFFLILRFTVTLFNFLSNPKITFFRTSFSDTVTIVVTVKNEESNLLNLLDSIKRQDYMAYEVFIFHSGMDSQDESTIEEYCSSDARFELVKGSLNNFSWLESRMKGSYLMLLDSNTQINKGFINALIYRTKVFKLGILSVIPTQIIKGFKQEIILPLSDFLMLNMVPLRLIRLFKTSILSTVNTDCIFMDAGFCFKQQWLGRLDPAKGTSELLKMVKQDRFRAETLLGNNYINKQTDLSRNNLVEDAAENLISHFNGNLFTGLIYIFLVVPGPVIIFFGIDLNVLILPFGLIFLSRVMIAFLTVQNPIYQILVHPLQMFLLVVVYIRALTKQLLTRRKHKAG
jgi:glycosyltransferase involved in cell wall biosynthesis